MANFDRSIRERIHELSWDQKYYSQMDVVYNLEGALINIFCLAAVYRHVSVVAVISLSPSASPIIDVY